MKKTLYFMMVGAFLFASCRKTEPADQKDEKLYEVKFNVSLFSQTVTDFPVSSKLSSKMTTKDATPPKLSRIIGRLDYLLYNQEGTRIANRSIYRDSSEIGFELPTANLKAGKYRVVFIGIRDKYWSYHGGNVYYNHDKLNPNISRDSWESGGIYDLFFSSVEFQVGGEDSYVDISMKRMGGRLKVLIEDEWPSNIERIGLSLNFPYYYSLGLESMNFTEVNDITVPKNYTTKYEIVNGYPVPKQVFVDCSWENFIFATSTQASTLSGTLTAYSKYNDVVVTKNLTNIKVERNKVTTVRGKLFDDLGFNPTSSFNLTIDSAMAGEINQTF